LKYLILTDPVQIANWAQKAFCRGLYIHNSGSAAQWYLSHETHRIKKMAVAILQKKIIGWSVIVEQIEVYVKRSKRREGIGTYLRSLL